MAPKGRLLRVLKFTFEGDRIARAEVVSDPAQLAGLDIATTSSVA
jgi:RNA polymerase sigma-70 factor (ECF subfamily)